MLPCGEKSDICNDISSLIPDEKIHIIEDIALISIIGLSLSSDKNLHDKIWEIFTEKENGIIEYIFTDSKITIMLPKAEAKSMMIKLHEKIFYYNKKVKDKI